MAGRRLMLNLLFFPSQRAGLSQLPDSSYPGSVTIQFLFFFNQFLNIGRNKTVVASA